jgi:hypothetical protein
VEWGEKILIGLFYRSPFPRPSLDALEPALKDGPLVHRQAGLTAEQRRELIEEFM